MSEWVTVSEVDGTHCTIDASHGTHYVYVYINGAMTDKLAAQCVHDLTHVMDRVVGKGATFPPIIMDIRQMITDGETMPAMMKMRRGIRERLTGLAIVCDPQGGNNRLLDAMLQAMSLTQRNLIVVRTVDKALDAFGVDDTVEDITSS